MIKKHYPEIDKLRGIAICMVLLYHSILVFPVNLHEIAWCRLLHTFLWKIEMPLFFMVSGFCMTSMCIAGWKGYGGYLSKKGMRVFVPHLVFGMLDIFPRVIPNPLVNEQMDVKEAVTDFLFFGGSDWFLWTLFLIFLVFPGAVYLYQTGRAGKILVAGMSLLLYFFSGAVTNLFLFSTAAEFQVYFVIGYLARQEIFEKDRQARLEKAAPAFLGGAVMTLLYAVSRAEEKTAGMLLFAAAGGIFFLWIAKKSGGWAEKLLLVSGKYSLQMYLLGGYALVFSRTVLVTAMGISSPVIIILGNFVLDAILTIGVTHFIIRPVKPFRILCGL